MMIFKYELPIQDEAIIEMPLSAEAKSVAMQNGLPYVWAIVDPALPTEKRTFYVRGTGHPLRKANPEHFIGTIQMEDGRLVFHIFGDGK